jgi:hypothetical protein
MMLEEELELELVSLVAVNVHSLLLELFKTSVLAGLVQEGSQRGLVGVAPGRRHRLRRIHRGGLVWGLEDNLLLTSPVGKHARVIVAAHVRRRRYLGLNDKVVKTKPDGGSRRNPGATGVVELKVGIHQGVRRIHFSAGNIGLWSPDDGKGEAELEVVVRVLLQHRSSSNPPVGQPQSERVVPHLPRPEDLEKVLTSRRGPPSEAKLVKRVLHRPYGVRVSNRQGHLIDRKSDPAEVEEDSVEGTSLVHGN